MSHPREPEYYSRFGGFWTDRKDAHDVLAARVESGQVDADDVKTLGHWIDHGWVIFPSAVAPETIERIEQDLERAWAGDFPSVWVEYESYHVLRTSRARPDLRHRAAKMLDLYIASAAAREALFTEPIRKFLTHVFDDAPMAFQGLTFLRGSEQDIHQDTAYVVVDSPMKLAASWIALEDITPGSGELIYYDGSHRIAEFLFEGQHKAAPPDSPEHDAFLQGLHDKSKALGCEMKSFLPKRGDALIWSADLCHGGAPITTDATRKSLVTHYCPVSCTPGYFTRGTARHSEKMECGDGGYYCHTIQG